MFASLFKKTAPPAAKPAKPSPYDAMTIDQLKKEVVKSQHPDVFGYLDQSHKPTLTKSLLIAALALKDKKINAKCQYEKQRVYGMLGPVLCRQKK